MFTRIFGGKPDPQPASPQRQDKVPSTATATGTDAASPNRVMKDIVVFATGRDLPKQFGVLTDRGGRYAVRDEDHQHVALLDTGGGELTLIWNNTYAAKSAYDALVQRVKLDGVTINRVCEAPNDVLLLLYRRRDIAPKPVEKLEITRASVQDDIDNMVRDAIRRKASDIHLNADESTAVILFRVHGALVPYKQLRTDAALQMSHALHAQAEGDSKQTAFNPRDYQDAAITKDILVDNVVRHVKLRFASLMTHNSGWDIVLRVLYQDSIPGTLADLGYDELQEFDMLRMLAKPKGLVALCGTTGSGKSTTTAKLLEMLHVRHKGSRLIRTIEDPVEYVIPGARQHPVVRGTGVDDGFLKAFRACMRGDPDILSVGEVRDHATTELLQHAVQSGHKVFATVHAGDPFEAIFRLIHMGVGRSDIASDNFISGVIYQRLLRVLCPECSLPMNQCLTQVPPDLFRRIMRLSLEDAQSIRFAGNGCENCSHTGYIGRTVAAEMLNPDREILHHILHDDRLLATAYWRAGMCEYDKSKSGRTALDQGIHKMSLGQVSPLDVEAEIGVLDDQRTPEAEREWYQKAMRSHRGDSEYGEERGGK